MFHYLSTLPNIHSLKNSIHFPNQKPCLNSLKNQNYPIIFQNKSTNTTILVHTVISHVQTCFLGASRTGLSSSVFQTVSYALSIIPVYLFFTSSIFSLGNWTGGQWRIDGRAAVAESRLVRFWVGITCTLLLTAL